MGTDSFPGEKRPGRGADHPPPSKRRGHKRVGLYLYSPSGPQWRVMGRTFIFYVTLSLHFVVSKWSKICPCWQCTTLFVWAHFRCVAFLHLVISKKFAFQLFYNKPCALCNTVRNFKTCPILHHGFQYQLNFPKINSKMLHQQFSNFTLLQTTNLFKKTRRPLLNPKILWRILM